MAHRKCETTFADRLGQARHAAGLSQAALADAAGVPVATIRNLEQGRRQPSLAVAARLAVALGVSLDTLAGLK